MKAGDSILRDVIAAIESHTKIRRQDVESWMHATDAQVLGAVSKLITEESSRRRIEPALSTTQLRDFHFRSSQLNPG